MRFRGCSFMGMTTQRQVLLVLEICALVDTSERS